MPLFRGRQPASTVWQRFRSGVDTFTFTDDDGHYCAHVVASAERVLDLFYSLSEILPPAVDVAIEDLRTARRWRGEQLALSDVRDAVARLRLALASHAGVEIAIYSSEDQLTLTPELELYIYARTDRWLYLLLGKGLEESDELPGAAWQLRAGDLDPSPVLQEALSRTVEQLLLVDE